MGKRSALEEIRVLVAICHHVGTDLIERCLRSVGASFNTGLWLKTVVVTSTDQIFQGVITVRDGGGPAHKRNLAVSTYGRTCKYIVFLDDDVEVSPYCIWNLVYEMEQKPNCGMGFAKILKMDRRDVFDDCGSWITPSGFLYSRAGNSQVDGGQYDESARCLASKSATCCVRSKSFVEAGGFDSDYYILGEETDLAWRIWLKGGECWYFPGARSWHAFDTAFKPKSKYYTLDRIHFYGCKNYINLLLTNLGGWKLCQILPIHLFGWCVSAVGFAARGQWRRSFLIFKGIFWNVIKLPRTMAKRRKVQKTRTRPDRELWPVISYSPPLKYYADRLVRYVGQGLHG